MKRLKTFIQEILLRLDMDIRMRYLPVLYYLKQRDPGKGDSVLEIGSGPLGLTRYLKREVVGFDRDFIGKGSPWLKRCQGNATHLAFTSRSFDHVVSVDLVENLTPKERVLAIQEMLRVARKGVLIVTPCSRESQKAEEALKTFYLKHGKMAPSWLTHHLRNGLPEEGELIDIIQSALTEKGLEATLSTQSNQPLGLWRYCNRLFTYGTVPFFGMMLLLRPFWPLFSLFASRGKPYRKAFLISLLS